MKENEVKIFSVIVDAEGNDKWIADGVFVDKPKLKTEVKPEGVNAPLIQEILDAATSSYSASARSRRRAARSSRASGRVARCGCRTSRRRYRRSSPTSATAEPTPIRASTRCRDMPPL